MKVIKKVRLENCSRLQKAEDSTTDGLDVRTRKKVFFVIKKNGTIGKIYVKSAANAMVLVLISRVISENVLVCKMYTLRILGMKEHFVI